MHKWLAAVLIPVVLVGLALATNVRGQTDLPTVGYLALVFQADIPTALPTATTQPTMAPSPTQEPTATPTLPPPTFGSCADTPNPASAPNYPVRITRIETRRMPVDQRSIVEAERGFQFAMRIVKVRSNTKPAPDPKSAPGAVKSSVLRRD